MLKFTSKFNWIMKPIQNQYAVDLTLIIIKIDCKTGCWNELKWKNTIWTVASSCLHVQLTRQDCFDLSMLKGHLSGLLWNIWWFQKAYKLLKNEKRVVGKGSWKRQLERTRSLKVLNWKVWSWKVWLKLERAKRSWKESSEVGENRAKLERTERNWKASFEVGNFRCSWKVLAELGKLWLKLESSP